MKASRFAQPQQRIRGRLGSGDGVSTANLKANFAFALITAFICNRHFIWA